MIKISTRGRYGLRFLLELAIHRDRRAVALVDVAKRQGISQKYLWQVVSPLKAAGIIEAVRGAHGGYRLRREPDRLTIREIVDVLEGGLAFTPCAEDDSACDRSATCVLRSLWKKFGDDLARSMESVTLRDLAEEYRNCSTTSLVYEI